MNKINKAKRAISERDIFTNEIKISHLKKVDELFNKGLNYYLDPKNLGKSKEESIFFRKESFNAKLNIGAKKIAICQTSSKNDNKNIVGIWQAGTNEVSSGYLDTYRFYENNKFEFKPTEYNGLNRIVKIAGTYKIDNAKIIFHATSITELVGDKIERSMTSTLSDSWAIEDGKLVTRKIKSAQQIAAFEYCKSNENKQDCFQIDNRTHYKIEVQ